MLRQAGTYILVFFLLGSVNARAGILDSRVKNFPLVNDTVPAAKAIEPQPVQQSEIVEVPPVIKQVPKSRKQVKPVAIPKIVTAKPKSIIKPRIVIKTGLIN